MLRLIREGDVRWGHSRPRPLLWTSPRRRPPRMLAAPTPGRPTAAPKRRTRRRRRPASSEQGLEELEEAGRKALYKNVEVEETMWREKGATEPPARAMLIAATPSYGLLRTPSPFALVRRRPHSPVLLLRGEREQGAERAGDGVRAGCRCRAEHAASARGDGAGDRRGPDAHAAGAARRRGRNAHTARARPRRPGVRTQTACKGRRMGED